MPTERDVKFPDLHRAQQQIVREAKRFNVVCAGRRFGKNVLALELLIMPALEGKPVAFFSATNKLLAEAWRDLCSTLAPVTTRKLEQEHRLELSTGGVIDCWSLEGTGAGRGRKYARVVVDEAAQSNQLETLWNEDLRPTLTDYSGDAWFLSTPRGRNGFWRLFRKGQSADSTEWMSWQFPSSANPYLPPGEVEAARKDMPERAYGQEYLALFIEETGGVFRKIAESIDRGRRETSIITDPNLSLSLGVDVARHNDWNVLTILAANGVQVYHERFKDISWPRIIAAIEHATTVFDIPLPVEGPIEMTRNLPIRRLQKPFVILDSTGVGDVVFDALLERRIEVINYTFNNANKRRIMDSLASNLENGRLRLMDIEAQENELIAYEYNQTPAGTTTMNAPTGENDDCVVSLALANYGISGGGYYSAC